MMKSLCCLVLCVGSLFAAQEDYRFGVSRTCVANIWQEWNVNLDKSTIASKAEAKKSLDDLVVMLKMPTQATASKEDSIALAEALIKKVNDDDSSVKSWFTKDGKPYDWPMPQCGGHSCKEEFGYHSASEKFRQEKSDELNNQVKNKKIEITGSITAESFKAGAVVGTVALSTTATAAGVGTVVGCFAAGPFFFIRLLIGGAVTASHAYAAVQTHEKTKYKVTWSYRHLDDSLPCDNKTGTKNYSTKPMVDLLDALIGEIRFFILTQENVKLVGENVGLRSENAGLKSQVSALSN